MMARAVIDLHSHWFSPAALDLLGRRTLPPRIVDGTIEAGSGRLGLGRQWYDVDHRLAHLDRHRVVHQLLSWPTTLNLEPALGADEAKSFWRAANDDFGMLVRRHPDRFSALAVLSTEDVHWSVQELRRAHDELGLIGFVLPINALASVAGARHLAPLLAEAQSLRAHVYLHTGYGAAAVPGQPAPVERPENPGIAWTLAAMHHFASAFATIALTDALDDFPDLTVQVAMLGGAGAAALLVEQVRLMPARHGIGDISARMERITLDTGAAGQGPVAIGAAADIFGSDRIVFGSDYAPAEDVGAVLANVKQAPLRADELDAILFGNAQRLLGRHGITIASPGSPAGASHVGI